MVDPLERFSESFSLDELKEQQTRLNAEIAELQRRLHQVQKLMSVLRDLATEELSDEEFRLINIKPPLRDAVINVMRDEDPARVRVWTGDDVLQALEGRGWAPGGKTPRNSVDATLSRLNGTGHVTRVAPGRYRLAQPG